VRQSHYCFAVTRQLYISCVSGRKCFVANSIILLRQRTLRWVGAVTNPPTFPQNGRQLDKGIKIGFTREMSFPPSRDPLLWIGARRRWRPWNNGRKPSSPRATPYCPRVTPRSSPCVSSAAAASQPSSRLDEQPYISSQGLQYAFKLALIFKICITGQRAGEAPDFADLRPDHHRRIRSGAGHRLEPARPRTLPGHPLQLPRLFGDA
jgi:hypothetical protein